LGEQARSHPEGAVVTTVFAVSYSYPTDTTRQDAIRPAHLAYLGERIEAGDLLVSGPWGLNEAPGALLIYGVEDRAAIQHIVDHDPFVVEKVAVSVEIHEWRPLSGKLASTFAA
jgi:uncharacterized protein